MLRIGLLILGLCFLGVVSCQEINVSFKIILDPVTGDAPPYLNPDPEATIQSYIDTSNSIIQKYGRGLSFNLVGIDRIGGVGESVSIDFYMSNDTDKMQDTFEDEYPQKYLWNSNAINVYLNNSPDDSQCSFPSNWWKNVLGSPADKIIVIRDGSRPLTVLIHEIGHFFSLCHTHGCDCGVCSDCPVPESDEIEDTLDDSTCYTNRDQISQNSYNRNYIDLNISEKISVDETYENVMSYRIPDFDKFTHDQLDRWVQSIYDHKSRRMVITSLPIYVKPLCKLAFENEVAAHNNVPTFFGNGSPYKEFYCFSSAYQVVNDEISIIVLREGDHKISGDVILSKDCLLVSDGVSSSAIISISKE